MKALSLYVHRGSDAAAATTVAGNDLTTFVVDNSERETGSLDVPGALAIFGYSVTIATVVVDRVVGATNGVFHSGREIGYTFLSDIDLISGSGDGCVMLRS